MLIGIISDTHDNLQNLGKAISKMKDLKVEAIIHLGDITSPFTLKYLAENTKGIKKYAIFGNNDGDKLYLKKVAENYEIELTEQPRIIEIDGSKMLLFHGFESIDNTINIAISLAKSRDYESIVFGHIHKPYLNYINGVLILSPGEITGVFGNPSFAIVRLPSNSASIVYIK